MLTRNGFTTKPKEKRFNVVKRCSYVYCVRNELLNCLLEASATAGYGLAIIQLEMAGYQYVEAGK